MSILLFNPVFANTLVSFDLTSAGFGGNCGAGGGVGCHGCGGISTTGGGVGCHGCGGISITGGGVGCHGCGGISITGGGYEYFLALLNHFLLLM